MGRLRTPLIVGGFALLASLAFVGVALAAGKWKVKATHAGTTTAKAAVLRKTDFPPGDGTWASHAAKPNLSTAYSCKSNYHPKQSDLVVTGSAEVIWTNGGLGLNVDDLALALKVPAMGHLYYQRMVASPKALSCLKASAKKTFGSALVSLGVVAFPHVGTYSHEIRTVATLAGGSGPVQIAFDQITVVRGHTVMVLNVEGPAALLPSVIGPLEVKLAKKLASRAK